MVLSRSTWVWLWAGLGLAALSQYLQWVSGIYSFVAPHSEPLADLVVGAILGGDSSSRSGSAPLVAAGSPTAKCSKSADTTAAAG